MEELVGEALLHYNRSADLAAEWMTEDIRCSLKEVVRCSR
jgi:hypothetical protein